MERLAPVSAWVFDLDNTLYNADTHVFVEMRRLMHQYMRTHLKMDELKAGALRDRLWRTHGTTLRGLMMEYDVDPHHFLNHTHDIDVTPVPRDEMLVEMISALPGRKFIFSNTSRPFAERLITHLGFDVFLDGTFCIQDAQFDPKPHPQTYQRFIESQAVNPTQACMFEDTMHNLEPAAALGMATVWIDGARGVAESTVPPYVHQRVPHLKASLSQYFEGFGMNVDGE